MIIKLDNLRAGISWFRDKWGKDLINEIYYELYDARSRGLTEQWWAATVDRLGKWHAYRGRRPPNTKQAITAAGLARLPELAACFSSLTRDSPAEPCIVGLGWEKARPLFELASSIKPSTPVLPSKLCHFAFPKLFTVMDNEATSVFDYEFYWRGMRDEWLRFPDKDQAIRILTSTIDSARPLHPLYPLETKIMELSHIGYNSRRALRQ